MNILMLQVLNLNWLSNRSRRTRRHTGPGSSTTTPSFLHAVHRCRGEANESWRIQSRPDVRVPPLLVQSPLTERAIWAAESRRQAHPSLRPALWACSQRDRLGELAGISALRSLAKMEHVLMILAFSGVKNVHESLHLMRLVGFSHVV